MAAEGVDADVSRPPQAALFSGENTFVTGGGKADFIIQLKGALALSGSDFLLG